MRLAVDDVEIELEEAGDSGPALILVHGLGGSRKTWSGVLPLLAEGARVFAPDLRGCGDSTRGVAPYTLARAAADIDGVANALGLENFILVGHSLGGVIVQELLCSGNSKIAGAVLVATSSRLNEKASDNWRRLADLVEAKGVSDSPSTAARGFAEEFAGAHPEVVAAHSRISAATNARTYADQARAASSYDYTDALASVSCPVLVVQGLADRLTPPGGSVLLHRALPAGARLEMIEGAGHNLPIEMPVRFAELVLSFARALVPDSRESRPG
jgi:3-oxoadipate enol-lactonase